MQQQPGQRQQSVGGSGSSAPYISIDPPFQGLIHRRQSCCSVCQDRTRLLIHESVHPAAYLPPSIQRCAASASVFGKVRHIIFEQRTYQLFFFFKIHLLLIGASSSGDYRCIQRSLTLLDGWLTSELTDWLAELRWSQVAAAVMAKSPEVKLAVFGRAGVGKSALVVRFLTRRFIWEYDPTLESTYRHQANIDDEVVTMEILDTAGQEDNQQKEGHMRWGDGFVIVYDITDRGSFEEVAPLRSLLEEVKKPKNVPLVLVGNKSDLDHVRQVGTEEGERLAAEMACAFYECSACADEGGAVAEAFHELCREVRRRKAVQGKARRRSSTTHVKQAINKMLTKISS